MPTIKGTAKDNKLIGDSDVFGVTNYIYGYGGNDTLEGGFSASNYIWGGIGNDTIEGGSGLNRLYGEDGDDKISVFWAAPDSQLFGGAGSDTLVSGSWTDGFHMMGSAGIYMDGGTGADLMIGGKGGDVFIIDNAKDQVIETFVPQFDNQVDPVDTVRASVSYTLATDALVEVLETVDATKVKAINLVGNAIAQTIKGNAGNNILDGKGGNDVLIGGAGADALIGGTGSDTASYAAATTGVTVSLAKASINTGEASGDTFDSVENITGSRFADKIYGDKAANKLVGGAGDDFLSGSAGKDALKGDAGNDKLNGGLDSDTLTGGSGSDTFVFTTTLGAANVDRITDFNVTNDTIQLDNAIFTTFTKLGAISATQFVANKTGLATDKLDRIIYETDTGNILYDADGTGAGKAIHFATVTAGLSFSVADFIIA